MLESKYSIGEDITIPESNQLKQDAGSKMDRGKLRYDLIPIYPLTKLAEVYTIGSYKYADDNWRNGITWSRLYGALLRHTMAWAAGESNDPENGQHHLASVAWIAFTLMEYEKTHPELDNRVRSMPTDEALLRIKDVS